jgi:hypothetical protein
LTLMLAIAGHVNADGMAWPSVARLARLVRLTERQTHNLIRTLVESGELAIDRAGGGRGRSNRYRIALPDRNTEPQFTETGFSENNSLKYPSINPEIFDAKPCNGLQGNLNRTIKNRNSVRSDRSEPDRFDEFYNLYPRHEARKKALEAWRRLKPSPEMCDRIIADLKHRAQTTWQGKDQQFIPLPASYLNGRRWEDETAPATTNGVLPPTSEEYYKAATS